MRVGGCLAVVAQWQSTDCTNQVSWVRFPVTAGLYFRLKTSLNSNVRVLREIVDVSKTLKECECGSWLKLSGQSTSITQEPSDCQFWVECNTLNLTSGYVV